MQFVNQKIAILGLGQEGRDLRRWVKKNTKNCELQVFDKIKTIDLTGFERVFRSPGFWRRQPMFLKAEARGVKISSVTKLFFELCPCPIIGVTGTKGKGTTATLITRILKAGGKTAWLAGNIGKPMLSLLPKLKKNHWVCLELSSFQLQDLTVSPHISVVLNITRDHLDVHQNIAEYRQAKTNILRYQKAKDLAVINADYPVTKNMAGLTPGKIVWFSRRDVRLDPEKIKLRGAHNRENISAAMAVAKIIGIDFPVIEKNVYSFKGLEHRLERVAARQGVTYFNDSFATTPETAMAAIAAFREPLVLILGGSDKGSDYRELGRAICISRNLKAVILIGQMGPIISRSLDGFKGQIISGGKNMAEIVKQAQQLAVSGDVVVLSPACASFDMFKNYKERGKQFKAYVKALL